jgi:hypothetical protein
MYLLVVLSVRVRTVRDLAAGAYLPCITLNDPRVGLGWPGMAQSIFWRRRNLDLTSREGLVGGPF